MEYLEIGPRMMNLEGKIFNRLMVLGYVGKDKNGIPQWHCICDCGNEKIIASCNLTSKNKPTKSCGCLNNQQISENNFKHGMTYSPEWKSWTEMKSRCYCKTNKKYYRYGGRGISVCKRWLESFENFYKDMGRRPKPKNKYSLGRIDNNGDYEPNNCRWENIYQQANNKSSNIYVDVDGEKLTVAQACRKLGIVKAGTAYARIYRHGWEPKKAVSTPPLK